MHAQATGSTALVDLDALRATPLADEPFDHVVVPGFVPGGALESVLADFPEIGGPGSFPADGLASGPAFAALLGELRGPAVRQAFTEKFGLELASEAAMITLRGQVRRKDGQIHADSRSKVLTALIYLNPDWPHPGGRLRLLRSPDDIEDYAVEVPPAAGTLVAFRCTEHAWHGHLPAEGPRASVQLNWVRSRGVAVREQMRHRLSARLKRLLAPARP